jgi:O-antigen ligase
MLRSIKNNIRFFKKFMTFPAVLFVLLWVGINTGPWVFDSTPQTLMQYVHYFRTLVPYIDLYLVGIGFLAFYHRKLFRMDISVRMWLFYGIVALLASLNSPHPFDSSYWAFAYIAVIMVSKLFLTRRNTLQNIITLNHLTWLMTSIFLLIILKIYGNLLFEQATGYGIVNRAKDLSDMALPRASGVARFAAIPSIVAFVLMWNSKHVLKLFWGVLFLASAYLVYFMQSRGAIIALAGTLVLIMAFVGKKAKLMGALAVILLIMSFLVDIIPEHMSDQIINHLLRGQSLQEVETLTGRTRAWEHAMEVVSQSPVIGYGFQADRWLIHEHVHSAYMYALLAAGVLGLVLFILGYYYTWVNIVKNFRNMKLIRQLGQATMFTQTVGIVTFFTFRSIPEVSGAMYAVDFMVLIPAMLYLGVLKRYIQGLRKELEMRRRI